MIPVLGVPTMTRHDLCDRMLASVDYPVADLIVIDNKPDGWEPVKPPLVLRLHHLRMPSNMGVATSWNLIIKSLPFAEHWVIVNDDVVFEAGALAEMDYARERDQVLFFDVTPNWAAFCIGDKVIESVGLFSELFYPAYFEDTDYERRLTHHSIVRAIAGGTKAHHDNSSTLKSGFDLLNHKTFRANSETHNARSADNIQSGGEWDLSIRRELSWD